MVGVGVTVDHGKLSLKGFEVGTKFVPSFSNINDDGTINMNLGGNSSKPRLHEISSPILLETHEGSTESKGIWPNVDPEDMRKHPFQEGPTVSLESTDVLLVKGHVASQKGLERRKMVTGCVGKFDLAVKCLGPNVRRAQLVSHLPNDFLNSWCVDSSGRASKGSNILFQNSGFRKVFSQSDSFRRNEMEGIGISPIGDGVISYKMEVSR